MTKKAVPVCACLGSGVARERRGTCCRKIHPTMKSVIQQAYGQDWVKTNQGHDTIAQMRHIDPGVPCCYAQADLALRAGQRAR